MIGYSLAALGSPTADKYCMKRMDAADTCDACFNWGDGGTIGAREIATNACGTAVSNTVTDCMVYNGAITSTKQSNDCLLCKNKVYLNISETAGLPSVLTCSDTASVPTTCTAAVTNCGQTMCYTDVATSTSKVGCRVCSKGYKGSGTQIVDTAGTPLNLGYDSCATQTLTNCDLASPESNTKCYTCATGFAVDSAETACAAFTTDANCRMLHTDSLCIECWYSYYFTASVCTLTANIMALGGMVMFVLAFFN